MKAAATADEIAASELEGLRIQLVLTKQALAGALQASVPPCALAWLMNIGRCSTCWSGRHRDN